MVDLDELEHALVEEYRSATAPPGPVADAMLEGLVAAAPATAVATTSTTVGGVVMKMFAGLAIGGAIAGGIYLAAGRGDDRDASGSPSASHEPPSAPVSAPRAARPDEPAPALEPEPDAEQSKTVHPPRELGPEPSRTTTRKHAARTGEAEEPATTTTPAPGVQRPSSRDSLARETRLVKQADGELRGGHLDAATRTIETYRREFSDGVLANEMGALEHILACEKWAPGAAESARRFVQSHAGGLAQRVSDACLETKEK